MPLMRSKREVVKETQGIISMTAGLSGMLKQFYLPQSKSYCLKNDSERIDLLQEHVYYLLGAVQRLAVIVEEILP